MPVTLNNVWLPTSSSGATATHISRPLLLESGKSVVRDQRDPRGSTNQRDTEPHSTHLQHIFPYQSFLPSKTDFPTYMEQNPLSLDNNIRSKNSSQIPLCFLSTTEARNTSITTTEGFYQNQFNLDITKPINPHHSISFPVGNISSSNCTHNNSFRSSACYYNLTPLDSISPTNSRISGMFLNTHQHTANTCPISHSQNNLVSTSVTSPSYMCMSKTRFIIYVLWFYINIHFMRIQKSFRFVALLVEVLIRISLNKVGSKTMSIWVFELFFLYRGIYIRSLVSSDHYLHPV